ncbi:kinesin-like protein KLP2 [Aphis gossypii]|uniref:kinesin-like protein KLP2 n=1 Tax=Aphis gossypii TaxID=80765 RepID=UPI0021596DFC|nr:kinesin-like protein KLP2 [Aphis gossypii]
MDNLMDKSQYIKIYCRLKPLKSYEKSIKYEITNNERLGVDVLDLKYQSYRYNHDTYKYRYNGVFNENTSQSLIFETVAVPILDKFLAGMNCTIFTYGQTSSGKTHTMYGTKKDLGIIPRSLEYLFKYTEELNFEFQMEYIEIYQNDIYDLFGKKKKKNMPSNNKIKYGIGKGGSINYKNTINTIKITKLQHALKLLKMGNEKKKTACTSSNITSSRSHCICTIKYKIEQEGPEIKFNLVDLAGSENISNTTDDKKTLIESRSINSSLHHLNHVIRSLANPKVYVPYRNSTITSVLKDSLGTECATAMISTVVLNHRCIAESISTCQNSKEVSAIKYRVPEKKKINEKKQYKVIELNDVLLKEKEHDMSGGFHSKVKENKIVLEDKTTNTENNEYLINESIDTPRVLYDKLKDDGICMNVTYDVHDDRYKLDDFAIGDGFCVPVVDVTALPVMEFGDGINDTHDNSKMTKVHDMLPLFVECGIGTEDILVTQSEHDDKNIYTPLKNSLINRASNFYWGHYKMIQLILITIILMLNSHFFISTVGFDIHSFKNTSDDLNDED